MLPRRTRALKIQNPPPITIAREGLRVLESQPSRHHPPCPQMAPGIFTETSRRPRSSLERGLTPFASIDNVESVFGSVPECNELLCSWARAHVPARRMELTVAQSAVSPRIEDGGSHEMLLFFFVFFGIADRFARDSYCRPSRSGSVRERERGSGPGEDQTRKGVRQ